MIHRYAITLIQRGRRPKRTQADRKAHAATSTQNRILCPGSSWGNSGFVSEGAGENLFMVKRGVVYTPDLSAGALDGITTLFKIMSIEARIGVLA